MAPPGEHNLALLGDDHEVSAVSMDLLLATIPDDIGFAAANLAAAASTAAGTPVAVAVQGDSGWHVVAGESYVSQASDVAGLVDREDGAVRAGRVAMLWNPSHELRRTTLNKLTQGCVWLALAIERHDAVAAAEHAVTETSMIRDVVRQLLSVRDLDQLLLSIADRTMRLLDADICGVLLREGDELRMRSCVGNRVVDTARLRMRAGQGVAGLVFLTGEPAKVDNYLDDRTISRDFVDLAAKEETESALAVPLRLHGEFIWVLEVWRRRPSIFTDQDVRRMVTFADFATIAIDNARLLEEQACAVAKMKEARDALAKQVTVLARSSTLQETLLETVLNGGGLAAVIRTAAVELGCQAAVYGPDGSLISSHGGRSLRVDLPTSAPQRLGRATVTLRDGERAEVWTRAVYADGDQIGSVCLLPKCPSTQTAEMMDVIVGQVAMACSLTLLRQRAASRARAEALEEILWDLLEGPPELRTAARTRAQQMSVSLTGPMRVLSGRLENVDELAAERGWGTAQTDRVRRDVLRTLREADELRELSLVGLRGDLVVAISRAPDRPAAKELANRLTLAVSKVVPGLQLTWGVSRAHGDPSRLPSAWNEARTALSAAYRMGGHGVFLYEELGIVRLLLGSGGDPDLQTFIEDVTGPLIAYDREKGACLIPTLRAYFDADCSQRLAAERLFIHHKTLRYRLERIKQLTGLDLNRHEDRMRADVALRLLQVMENVDER